VHRLHRGHDVLAGEPDELLVAERLDVLDAVPDAGHAPSGPVGVERGLDGAIADRMRGALEAGTGEQRHDLGVAPRVGPTRLAALALGVGLEEPRGARVDGAVDEELGRAAPPQDAARVAQRHELPVPVVRQVRILCQRHDHPQRQVAAALQLAEQFQRRGRPVHRVDAGEPERIPAAERGDAPLVALLGRRRGHRGADEILRGRLAQFAGRPAAAAHDLGVAGQRAGARDAGELERPRGRDRAVAVVEVHEGGCAADRGGEQVAVDGPAGEDAVGQAVPDDPAAVMRPFVLVRQQRARLVERLARHQVDAAVRPVDAHDRVEMAVDEPGDECAACEVDDPRARVARGADLGVVPGGDDRPAAPGHRRRGRALGVEGPDPGADDGAVGRGAGHLSPRPSAACRPGRAG